MKKRSRLNQQTVIQKLSIKHPTLDFSESQYKNIKCRIKVRCVKHGEFDKLVSSMLYSGQGCPSCGKECRAAKLKHDTEIKKSLVFNQEKHDNFIAVCKQNLSNDKVSLDKVKFFNMRDKVTVTCSDHGDVLVTAKLLYTGSQSCSKCGRIRSNESRRITKEEFLRRCFNVHGNKYSIDLSTFKDTVSRLRVVCDLHGEFFPIAKHLARGQGCPVCGPSPLSHRYKLTPRSARRQATKVRNFIDRVKETHGDRYDYSLTKYVNCKTKVIVICREHGAFESHPRHLRDGQGCPYCSGKIICPGEFQKKIDLLYGVGLYTCNTFEPNTATVTTKCNNCGNVWEAYRRSLQTGAGCPSCSRSLKGYDTSKPGILYNIKFTLNNGDICYKVGITNVTIKERLTGMGVNPAITFEILDYIEYSDGQEAYAQEKLLHKQYKEFRYEGPKFLENGWTELYTINPFTEEVK